MWIDFSLQRPWYKANYLIKIYIGGVNIISGEPTVETTETQLRS
jgi:hypothetical protein